MADARVGLVTRVDLGLYGDTGSSPCATSHKYSTLGGHRAVNNRALVLGYLRS